MGGIFSEGANFNEILEPNGNSIQVNDVIHKSIISVTEGGPPGSPANCNRCNVKINLFSFYEYKQNFRSY